MGWVRVRFPCIFQYFIRLEQVFKLTADEVITTEPRVFVRQPSFSIDGGNPLHFTLRVGWDSEKSLVGALARPVRTAHRTAGVWHLNSRGDKTQHWPSLMTPNVAITYKVYGKTPVIIKYKNTCQNKYR